MCEPVHFPCPGIVSRETARTRVQGGQLPPSPDQRHRLRSVLCKAISNCVIHKVIHSDIHRSVHRFSWPSAVEGSAVQGQDGSGQNCRDGLTTNTRQLPRGLNAWFRGRFMTPEQRQSRHPRPEDECATDGRVQLRVGWHGSGANRTVSTSTCGGVHSCTHSPWHGRRRPRRPGPHEAMSP